MNVSIIKKSLLIPVLFLFFPNRATAVDKRSEKIEELYELSQFFTLLHDQILLELNALTDAQQEDDKENKAIPAEKPRSKRQSSQPSGWFGLRPGQYMIAGRLWYPSSPQEELRYLKKYLANKWGKKERLKRELKEIKQSLVGAGKKRKEEIKRKLAKYEALEERLKRLERWMVNMEKMRERNNAEQSSP